MYISNLVTFSSDYSFNCNHSERLPTYFVWIIKSCFYSNYMYITPPPNPLHTFNFKKKNYFQPLWGHMPTGYNPFSINEKKFKMIKLFLGQKQG